MMINDDAFARLVSEDVKKKISPSQKDILMQQENWERWRDSLVVLVENLDRQINLLREDAESDADRYSSMGRNGDKLAKEASRAYQEKITKIERFKFHVDKRLDEVVIMIETGEEIENDAWDEVSFLKRAIAAHRKYLYEFDLEDTAVDRALWASLENKWEFDSITGENL